MNLGERIKQRREARGWNQKELAEHANVDRSIISLMERNARNGARPETLMKLANALGVTVDYLLGKKSSEVASGPVTVSPVGVAGEAIVPYGRGDLEPYRQAIDLAREHSLTPDDLVRLIRAATLFANK